MFETIKLTQNARGVATLTLNRPEKHNAMSARMIEELHIAADLLAKDEAVRVVILAAEGVSFCAGGDLGWMRAQFQADAPTRRSEATKLARMLMALNNLPKPLIGRVQGNAFGGGVGLISVCDVAIATDEAVFALTETRLGLIPATIGPYVAARMGEACARRVFMSGKPMSAQEAVRMNVLARSVPLEALDAAVEAEVAPYLHCAPGAVAQAKTLLRGFNADIDGTVIEASIDALVACWDGDEAQAGIAAFFDKCDPPWKNS